MTTTETDNRKGNRLIFEKSPYLLQHAHNPVNWYPWSEEAMTSLTAADWPGNVRELENAIERAVILCEGTEIKNEDLPPYIRKEYRNGESIQDETNLNNLNYKQAVEEYKKKLVRKAIKQAGGVQARAAGMLGIGRSTLNEIIKKLNIDV